MDVQLHHDLAEFVALTQPLLERDPVRHTIALTVTNVLLRAPEAGDPPVLMTVHCGELLAGAAICTPPWALIVSALTAECAGAGVEALARGYPSLHVVLFTDLANPVTNVIYPRIGFRPVHDAVEFAFTPAPAPQSGCRLR